MKSVTVISSTVPVWASYLRHRGYSVNIASSADAAYPGDVIIVDDLDDFSAGAAAKLLHEVDEKFGDTPMICLCPQQLDTGGYISARPNRLWLEPPVANMILMRAVDAMASLVEREEHRLYWMPQAYATAV